MKRAEGREGYTADNTEGIRWWRKSSRQSKRGFSSHVHTWKIFRTLDCLLLPRNSDIFTRIRAKEGRGMRDREKGCCEPVPPLSVERKIDINCCFSYSLSRLSHRSKRTSSTFRVFRFARKRRLSDVRGRRQLFRFTRCGARRRQPLTRLPKREKASYDVIMSRW